ncbi:MULTISPECIES: YolD-like family protein [Cytobacillus]|uniref:YolD-like family protein n=1 Tax=Cytobacillus TaxID=2675230 RepID=UPI0020403F57|nr:YolD-like family protein [Cytobacillus firmus]MCM3708634.1 YolD-like family protein [Cytobacillus firmus]
MPLKDRGKIKWQPAHFMPEHRAMLRKLEKEQMAQNKPLIDEYELEEYENKVHYAMEFAYPLKVKVWREGFFCEYKGRVNRLDSISRKIYLELESGELEKISFDEIAGADVEE